MTPVPMEPAQVNLDRIDGLLADIGTLARRVEAGTLTEADFGTLIRRSRQRLRALRTSLEEGVEVIELTDALVAARAVGQSPDVQALIRQIPGLMTAQQLAGHPDVKRARFHGAFAAIDGGLA